MIKKLKMEEINKIKEMDFNDGDDEDEDDASSSSDEEGDVENFEGIIHFMPAVKNDVDDQKDDDDDEDDENDEDDDLDVDLDDDLDDDDLEPDFFGGLYDDSDADLDDQVDYQEIGYPWSCRNEHFYPFESCFDRIKPSLIDKARPGLKAEPWVYEYKGGKTILDLNDDVLFEIISNLSNVREKIRLKQVCKRFDSVITTYLSVRSTKIIRYADLYYCDELVKLNEPLDSIHRPEICLESLLLNCQRISHLNTSIFTNQVWWELPNLEGPIVSLVNLELKASHPMLSNSDLEVFLQKCINLKTLVLWDFLRKKFDFSCLGPKLTSVEFQNLGNVESLLNLLKVKGNQLKRLKLEANKYQTRHSFVDRITNTELIQIIELCPNLESLVINHFAMLDTPKKLLQVKGLSEMKIRPLRPENRLAYEEYSQILKNNPQLTHLTLPIQSNEVLDFLKSCLAHCTRLQSIETLVARTYDKSIIDNIVKIWEKFPCLQEIDGLTIRNFANYGKPVNHPFMVSQR